MYAKLVVGGSQINVQGAMRDIARLITAATPSLSLLGAFSASSSVLVDATPAGWTYVGSNYAGDQPTIAGTGAALATTGGVNYCFSAPMQNNASILKYCVLTNTVASPSTLTFSTAGMGFNLTGASSATASGVVTNEGPRYYTNGNTSTYSQTITTNNAVGVAAGVVLHLIANPQHVTIVIENAGITAVWETTSTDVHSFYNIPAFVQYSHYVSSKTTQTNIVVPTVQNSSSTQTTTWSCAVFNVTNPNNGTNYGTYDPSVTNNLNIYSLVQSYAGTRVNACSATGIPQYAINPVYFSSTMIGYPTQFVTGPVPIYYVSGALGNTGDTVTVNGDTYYFFNCGTGFGVIMKTS